MGNFQFCLHFSLAGASNNLWPRFKYNVLTVESVLKLLWLKVEWKEKKVQMKRGPPARVRQYKERIRWLWKGRKPLEKQSFLFFHVLQKNSLAGLVQIDFSISLDIGLAKIKIINFQLKESWGKTIPDAKSSESPLSTGLTKVWNDLQIIPHICHERHKYTGVNFFGRCKFLQI